MQKANLKITIGAKGGDLIPEELIRVLRTTTAMLREYEKESAKTGSPKTHWKIGEVNRTNPLTVEWIGETESDEGNPSESIKKFTGDVRSVRNSIGRPPGMRFAVYENAQDLISVLDKGIEELIIQSESERLELLASEMTNAVLPAKSVRVVTELRGKLKQVKESGKKAEINLEEAATGRIVKCTFRHKDIKQVGALITDRVSVRGIAKYNRYDKPVSIKVITWRAIRPQSDLPQLDDLHRAGVRITDLPSEDAIREIRDAE